MGIGGFTSAFGSVFKPNPFWGTQYFLEHMGEVNDINGSHRQQVKTIRKHFKEYSKEDFRMISKRPLVKEILKGLATCPANEIADRIKQHIEEVPA